MRRRSQRPADQDADAFIDGAAPEAAPRIRPKDEPEDTVLFNLRLPESLHADLKRLSEATGRSMHEICLLVLEPTIRRELKRHEP